MGGPEEKPELAPTAHDAPGSKKPQAPDRPSMRPGGPESLIGTVLSGRYRIEKLLGEGGMGAVYQAEHTLMKKRLAVKVLHPEMSRLSEVVQRFEREARAAANIEHPNVAAATDFGKLEDGSFFLVLEFVEGKSLRDVIAEGRLELGRALHIARQIASALQRAHSLGIVHRDLKPENIMLVERDGDTDFVKLLDFGIAKVPVGDLVGEGTSFPGDLKVPVVSDPKAPVLTQLGMVYGTPEYMAPEQALGQPVDPRADLYALGIMMYEMLAGKRPFDHESKVALLGMHVTAPIPAMPQELGVPREVEQLIKKLLAKESTERTQDARELIEGINVITAQLAAEMKIEARYATGGTAVGVPVSVMRPSSQSSQSGEGPLPSAPGGASAANAPPPASAASPGAAAGAPPIILTPAPRSALEDRRRLVPLAAAGAGVLVLFVILAVILRRGGATPVTGIDGATATPVSASGSTQPTIELPSAPPGDQAREGLALIDKADYSAAIEKLESLTGPDRERPDVRRGLVLAYGARKTYGDAMREAVLLLKADAKAGLDVDVATVIRDAALGKEGADEAFGLLESSMGQYGLTILYEMAFADDKRYPAAAGRAQRILMKSDVRARATPAMQVNLDIRAQARAPCNIKSLLDRAREHGDDQTLVLLRPFTAMTKCGGGMRPVRPCPVYGCLMSDTQLRDTIATLEARSKKKG